MTAPTPSIGELVSRRLRRRGQGGYLLGVVLGAMVIGLALITSLLGLSFTTHRAALVQQELSRERRAADGALEAAVTEMRSAADPADPCDAVPETVPMDTDGDTTTEEAVYVECVQDLDPDPQAAGDVRVLGVADYAGEFAWDDSATHGTPVASDASLLHQGDEPLSFVGPVLVADGAAVNGDVNGAGSAPGAQVSGRYLQGDPGTEGSGTTCGLLTPGGSDPARSIEDADDGAPSCGDSSLKAALQGDNEPSSVAKPTVDVGPGDLPDPSVCPAGREVTLPAGYYGPAATGRLNDLFALDCDRTYAFATGTTWFDAPAADGFELALNDPGSSFLFGPIDATSVPSRCDPSTTAESTVVLGANTSLRHLGGHLSICGGEDSPQPALLASGVSAVANPTLDPPTNFGGPDTRFTNPAGAVSDDLSGAATAVICDPGTCRWRKLRATVRTTGSRPVERLALHWNSEESPLTSPAYRYVYVTLTKADGTLVCATPQPPVTPELWRGRTGGLGTELDLTEQCAGAVGTEDELEGATLEVGFRTAIPIYPGCFGFECPWSLSVWGMELQVNGSEVDAKSATSGIWTGVDQLLSGGGGLAVAEDCPPYPFPGIAIPPWSTASEIRGICDHGTTTPAPREFTISGFDLPAGLEPSDQLASVVLAIDNGTDTSDVTLAPDVVANPSYDPVLPDGKKLELGSTTVTVDDGTTSCSFTRGGYTRSRQTYFFDLDSECGSLVSSAADLASLSLSVSVQGERNMMINGFVEGPGVEIPKIDHARLIVKSSTVGVVRPVRLTVDETAGSSVRVHGDADMRLVDLDVAWNGVASQDPLFEGDLVANAISSVEDTSDSTTEVGVLCCGPQLPSVALTAKMAAGPGEPARGLARVRLEPPLVSTDPRSAVVTDWQLCHLEGCPL